MPTLSPRRTSAPYNKRQTAPVPAHWSAKTRPTPADSDLAEVCGISPVTAAILRVRGFSTVATVGAFLDPDVGALHDPFLLPDMEKAVKRLYRAVSGKEPLLVYGDYDVDGVTSTALLARSLRSLGADVQCRIPERKGEGYGLNVAAIDEAAAAGRTLIVTADCGTSDLEPAARARALGIDLIVTDHHEPGPVLPDAFALINPKLSSSAYPFPELSGCGVAFKLMTALMQRHWPQHAGSFFDKFVDLAGMAAVADCVPLHGENRVLAREGLRRLGNTGKLGLAALIEVARLKNRGGALSGRDIGFGLAPRLNAAGRLESALCSLQLLLSTDPEECRALAAQLEEHNLARRELQKRIADEAAAQVYAELDLSREMVIAVASEGWHSGVTGLVAGRLAERFGRPALVFNVEDGIATGSGRTAANFNLHGLVESLRPLLLRGGGHQAACGMSFEFEKWQTFRAAVLDHAAGCLSMDDLVPRVEADCEVDARDITANLVRDLEKLEPCGQGNPEPKLLLRDVKIVDGRGMGAKGEHLKWSIEAGGQRYEAVWWRPGERAYGFSIGKRVDICFVPELNEWNGNTRLQLVVKEARMV